LEEVIILKTTALKTWIPSICPDPVLAQAFIPSSSMSQSDSSGIHEPKAHLEIYSEPIGDDYKEREIRYGREYPQKHGGRHPWPIDEYEESRQPSKPFDYKN
ncbi:hypothetical protein AnigIFM50267_003140, partial [Aspergillus niger]